MHQIHFRTIAILSLLICGSAAAFQDTPELPVSVAPASLAPATLALGGQDPNQAATEKSSTSVFEPYYEKLKQDSARNSKPSQASNERVVGGDTIMIAWSEKLDELRGFSTKIGDWETLKIPPQKSIVPSVSTSVALVELEGAIAGFSASKCCWDVIELPKGVRAQILVDTSVLTVQTPDHIYTFASEKGRWTSPTDPEFQPMSESITVSDSAKMLHGGIYDQFQKWVESLPKHQAKSISLTGSAGVVRLDATRQSSMKAAKQKLAEWGYIGDVSTAQSSVGDLAASLKWRSKDTTLSTISVDELRGELEKLEAKIVDQLRSGEDSRDPKSKLAELRPQAEKAFDLRQQVLRLEAQRLQAKLKSIEESLQAREKNRDDLVSKRLNELGSAPKNETSSSKVEEASKGVTTAPPTIVQASGSYFEQVTSIARTLRALRKEALTIREDWLPHDNLIKQYSRPLADLIADGTVTKETTEADLHNQIARSKPMHESKGKELATAMKAWKQAWNSYYQQMRLLNLVVEKKRNELDAKSRLKSDTDSRFEAGSITSSETTEAHRQWNLARSELLEVTQVESIFRQISIDEPELNPEHDQK